MSSIFTSIYNSLKPARKPSQQFFEEGTQMTQKFNNKRHKNRSQDKQDIITEMKGILLTALNILKNKEEKVGKFIKNIANPKFKRGTNFEGEINGKGEIEGLALYYRSWEEEESQFHAMFFGELDIDSNQKIGEGVQVIIEVNKLEQNKSLYKRSYESFKIFYIYNHDPQNSQQKGCFIQRTEQTELFFQGTFIHNQFHYGTYQLSRNDRPKLLYTGFFENNCFEGEGKLIVYGKYEYSGNFVRNLKEGYGVQEDFITKTVYTGYFDNDRKNGYGELSYKDKNGTKLRGFWVDNFMKPSEGVYISSKTNKKPEIYHEDDHL